MELSGIFINSLWAALFATGLGILLTAPIRYLVPTFLCGFVGRFVRDLCVEWDTSQNWATLIAATVVVLVAVAIIRRHTVSPVVLVSGVLPLGAAVAMFNVIFELMRISTLKGEALSAVAASLNANSVKVFTISLAIALGIAVGIAVVRYLRRDEGVEV